MEKTGKSAALILLAVFVLWGCMPGSVQSGEKKDYEIVVIVKLGGIAWFNIMGDGVVAAGKEFGVKAYLDGPAEADAALQVQMVEDYINKGVDAIVCVPNDAAALEPAFRKARNAGIVVITNESPGQPGADWDYEMLNTQQFAKTVIDMIAEKTNAKGEYVMYVGGLTVPLHNRLSDAAVEYQKATYPGMKEVTDHFPVAESIQASFTATKDVLKAYPDLSAVIGWGSQGPIGAAEAVRDEERAGEIIVTGLAVPNQAADYLEDGSLTVGYLWNPYDAGYFGVYAALACMQGDQIKEGSTFSVPNSNMTATVSNGVINFDGLLTFTTDTVGDYDF